jgi:hypothetical protein
MSQFPKLSKTEEWKFRSRYWERRATRSRRYLEQLAIANGAGDQEAVDRILAKALDRTQEQSDLGH